jgi:anaphase-promoting complex subunit 6
MEVDASSQPLVLERLRSFVADCLDKHLLRSAIFFGDKLVSMSEGEAQDVHLLAQAYVFNGEHARALALLRAEKLTDASPRFVYLTAVCLVETSAWDDALALLGEDWPEPVAGCAPPGKPPSPSLIRLPPSLPPSPRAPSEMNASGEDVSCEAACCLLRGRVYAALENRPAAARSFKARALAAQAAQARARSRRAQAALSHDPLCYEAFEALLSGQMLTPGDEVALLSSLAWPSGCDWAGDLYRLAAASRDPLCDVPATLQALHSHAADAGLPLAACAQLQDNGDVRASVAAWRLARGDAAGAYAVTSGVLEEDSLRVSALPTHLAAAAELGKSNELFRRGHALVAADPTSGLAWYAVGCYYSVVGQPPAARRALARATTAAPHFAPGWIAYGHAFAAGDETEQALAAYRTAARLFQGAPAPLLWMGVEYGRAANWPLARQFLSAARDACSGDGAPHHELGCVALRCGDAHRAEKHFRDAIALAPQPLAAAWEPALLGLGHALRKQNRFSEAMDAYARSLALLPRSPVRCAQLPPQSRTALAVSHRAQSTLTALAFTHQLAGRPGDRDKAIDLYHHALGLRPEDDFAQEMLEAALTEAALGLPA